MGHTFTGEQPFSHLLELEEEARAPRRFVQFINANEINCCISMCEFEICPPLGLKHLQVIASKEDLMWRLPRYRFDEESEFYLVGKDPKDGLVNTQAAVGPKKKKPQKYNAEAVLTYTSLAK